MKLCSRADASRLAIFLIVTAFLGLGLLPSSAASTEPLRRLPAQLDVAAIDSYLAQHVRGSNHVGLSVAIVKGGHVVLEHGYGVRSRLDGRAVDPETLFAIGSVSKQFTCACILLLAEDGALSVRDKVGKYYPNLTRAEDITLLDLMNHVSGYPDYYPLDFVDRRMMKPIAEDELLRQYAGGKLDFEPGTRWSYSNTGYILLGRVVEKVSGMSLGAFLQQRIFGPLGMKRTVYAPPPTETRLAQGYTTFALSDPAPVAPEATGWLGGAGALYSTPGDLAIWDLALMDGKILRPDSMELMARSRVLTDGSLAGYGCGLSVKSRGNRIVLQHSGAVSGFATWNGMVPSLRSAVIVTCNLDGGLGSLPEDLFARLFEKGADIPTVPGPAAAEVARAVFLSLQSGRVERRKFAEEFNLYLTDAMIAGASQRLKRLGAPKSSEPVNRHERGGLEVTVTRLVFGSANVHVLMYRQPGGLIEQFFVSAE